MQIFRKAGVLGLFGLMALIMLMGVRAQAQVVMKPSLSASGSVGYWYRGGYIRLYVRQPPPGSTPWTTTTSGWTSSTTTYPSLWVRRAYLTGGMTWTTMVPPLSGTFFSLFISSVYYGFSDGVVEFDLAGLPTASMTASNFSARLGAFVTYSASSGGNGTMLVHLYDLGDGGENRAITVADLGNTVGGALASRTHTFGGPAGNFKGVDVTAALQRDLFGAGTGNPTSGFILIAGGVATPNSFEWLRYSNPTLTIRVVPNTPPALIQPINAIWVIKGAAPQTFSLFPFFKDDQDPDSQLIYTVIYNRKPEVATAAIREGELTLTFDRYGVTEIGIRATDRGELFVDTYFKVWVIFPPHRGGSLQDLCNQTGLGCGPGNPPANPGVLIELEGPLPE